MYYIVDLEGPGLSQYHRANIDQDPTSQVSIKTDKQLSIVLEQP